MLRVIFGMKFVFIVQDMCNNINYQKIWNICLFKIIEKY